MENKTRQHINNEILKIKRQISTLEKVGSFGTVSHLQTRLYYLREHLCKNDDESVLNALKRLSV